MTDLHVFLQKTPTIIANIDRVEVHVVPGEGESHAAKRLTETTGPPGTPEGLRNDAGVAYNVVYAGVLSELVDGPTDLTALWDSELESTWHGLPSGGEE